MQTNIIFPSRIHKDIQDKLKKIYPVQPKRSIVYIYGTPSSGKSVFLDMICGNPFREDHINVQPVEGNYRSYLSSQGKQDILYLCFNDTLYSQILVDKPVCVIVLYDVTSPNIDEINAILTTCAELAPDIPIFLTGNKIDAGEPVPIETDKLIGIPNHITLISISCKSTEYIDAMIKRILALATGIDDITYEYPEPQSFRMQDVRLKLKTIAAERLRSRERGIVPLDVEMRGT